MFPALPYCPDSLLNLCDPFSKLRGCIQQSRISGFPLEYTKLLLTALFASELEDIPYTIPMESAWPPLPTTSLPTAIGRVSLEKIDSPNFEVTLSPSLSFAQSFEDEMVKYDSSLSDVSNYTLVAGGFPREQEVEIEVLPNISSATDTSLRISRRYPSIAASYMTGLGAHNVTSRDNPRIHFMNQQLPRVPSVKSIGTLQVPMQPTHRNCRSLTPSPDTMNRLNEQDPAFLRTVQALQSPDVPQESIPKVRPFSDPMPPKLVGDLPTEEDHLTLSTQPLSEGVKKRCSVLLNRIRGRTIST